MALKFIEGFDAYDAAANIVDGRKWTTHSGLTTYGSLVAGRVAGQALRMAAGQVQKTLSTTYASGCFGFAFRISAYPSVSDFSDTTSDGIFWVSRNSVKQIKIGVDSSGRLVVIRQDNLAYFSTVLATSTNNITLGAWHYIEIKLVIDNSAGSVIINVDGVEWISFSGDTQNNAAADAYFDMILIAADMSGTLTADFDDFYFCDLTGSKNNDFLGDCRICTLYPDGDTADEDWTPDTGTDSYARINSETFDDAGYLESSTLNHKSIFDYDALPIADIGDVAGVQVVTRAKKDDEGARSMANVIVSASTEAVQTAYQLATQFTQNIDLLEDDPDTSDTWNKVAVNAMQCGVKLTA